MRKITNSRDINNISIFLGLGSSLLIDIGDYEEAFHIFKKTADMGDPESQYKLAYMYIKGLGCEKNEDEADKLFTLSFRKYSELAKYDSKAQYYISLMYFNGYGIPKDDEMAFKYCEKSANNGNSEALLDLGKMYIEGIGTKNNYKKGFDCFKKATDKIEAKYCLGLMYKFGISPADKDEKKGDEYLKEAFKYYKKREENEGDFIQFHLAFMYLEGLGTKQNYNKGIKCYKKIAKNGNSNAQFLVGLFYYYGLFNCKQDYNKAIKWFKKSAKQDNMDAELIIADMYFEGNGFIQDYKKAFNCYIKLAKKGNVEAKFNLGLLYYWGIGTKIDKNKAEKYFKQSCDIYSKKIKESNICACLRFITYDMLTNNFIFTTNNFLLINYYLVKFIYKISNLYSIIMLSSEPLNNKSNIYRLSKYFKADIYISHYNLLVHFKNFKPSPSEDIFEHLKGKDHKILKKLSEQGFAPAQFYLGDMYYYGKGIEKDYKKAFEWYSKSAEQGYIRAQFNLAGMYFEGKGVKQDYLKAFEWCKKSAEKGDILAQFNLGNIYYFGKGVEQDYKKALKWYSKSEEQGYIESSFFICKYHFKHHNYIKSLFFLIKYIFMIIIDFFMNIIYRCFLYNKLSVTIIVIIMSIIISIYKLIFSVFKQFFIDKSNLFIFKNYVFLRKLLSRDLLFTMRKSFNWFSLTKLYERFLKD